jgi:hypothetical protein
LEDRIMLARMLLVIGLVLGLTVPILAADKGEESYIKVEVKGTLQTGVAAIGGETTGVLLKTKDGTLELDLKDKEQRADAEKLNGKPVLVNGTLAVRKGVEIGQRLIVTVTSLKAADAKEK